MRHIRRLYLLPAGILLAAAGLVYFLLLADLPDPAQGQVPLPAASILINDRHGRTLYEVIDPNGNKHVPLPLAEIPLACRQATIATEDSRFYHHPGVDLLAIARAAWQNWRRGYTVSGASTLTQQLARNLYLPPEERTEQSLRRKLREVWLAWRLEQIYSKDEVLALYLNTTYYGHYAVGIEAAAQAYFGVHARELDLAQCALLAGLPQYPAGYNPIENPQAAVQRQKVVLGLMARNGYITEAQAQDAAGERLAYASTPFPIEAPHFVMWVQGQLEQMLGVERARAGGLRVTTTLDLDWQQWAEAIVRRRLAQLQPCAAGADPRTCDPAADPGRRVDNAALVALDPQTGAVLAMVGSPDYFDPAISGAVNAGLSPRQPGSAIKPLTYAAAFDPERAAAAGRAPWTPATLIADLRTVFPTQEGRPYVPQNYDLRYHGPVTARTALANSYNIPAVKALEYIGVDALIEQAARLGIPWDQEVLGIGDWRLNPQYPIPNPQSSPAKFGLALTLGGGEVRLLDLTAAYAAFANGGYRVTPFAISRIETLDGNDIGYWVLDNTQYPIPNTPALDPRVAYLITDILSDENARLPAFGPGNVLEIGRPAAAKTGTTTDWRDNWTFGYTPDLVTGVWVGNADNTPMLDVNGITGAGPIWHDFMVTVLRDTPPREFERPDGLVQVEVCADSGLLPLQWDQGRISDPALEPKTPSEFRNPNSEIRNPQSPVPCPNRRLEWFIAGTEPTEVDRMHYQVAIDVRTGEPTDEFTPAEYIHVETWWVLPPEFQEWARENHIFQPSLAEGQPSQLSLQLATCDLRPATCNLRPATCDLRPETCNLQPAAHNLRPATCPKGGLCSSLRLVSPDPNQAYRLDPLLPADAQRLPITARPGPELAADAPITLLLDGAPLATVRGPDYTAWWPLTRGQHVFQALAPGPDGTRVASESVMIFVEE